MNIARDLTRVRRGLGGGGGDRSAPNRVQSSIQYLSAAALAKEEGTAAAKSRLEGKWGEPLFVADWAEPVFLHFAVDPEVLQPHVPFPLDLRDGKAYLTLVAFTMRGMRFRWGGRLTRWLTMPIATHSFLNLRTYVKVGNEPGIHFLCEWLNSKLASKLGPNTFGLPYRFGELLYQHDYTGNLFSGTIRNGDKEIRYQAALDPLEKWETCAAGTIDEFLLERYTAFTARGKFRGLFRVWHEAWPQKRLTDIEIEDLSLLKDAPGGEEWADRLHFIGGNVSTGAKDVWMGRPHSI